MKGTGVCAAALCAISLSVAAQDVRKSEGSLPIRVPLEFEGRLPTVMATISGKPVSLFVDLGGYKAIALKASSGGSLDLSYGDRIERWRNSDGEVFSSRLFSVSDLKLGSATLNGLDGIELPGDDSRFSQDGYLGYPTLSRFVVVIDYPLGELRLYPQGAKGVVERECGASFPLQVIGGVVRSTVTTNEGPLIFQWDTGSTENVLRPSSLAGPSPTQKSASHPFSKFDVGGHDLGRIRIPLREFVAPDVDGILGTDFFESRVVCLDLQSRTAGIR